MKVLRQICSVFLLIYLFHPLAVETLRAADDDADRVPYPGIRRISEGFYVARTDHKGIRLWLVAEQVSPANVEEWKRYAEVQTNGKDLIPVGRRTAISSSDCFRGVLGDSLHTQGEVWVVYASRAQRRPRPIGDIDDYTVDHLGSDGAAHPFAGSITMYGAVVSHPDALIASTAGFAPSVEALAKALVPAGVLISLQSWAAQVMLNRNPDRKHLVCAPPAAQVMAFVDVLPPAAVSIGTTHMQSVVDARRGIDLRKYVVGRAFLHARRMAMAVAACAECARRNAALERRLESIGSSGGAREEYLASLARERSSTSDLEFDKTTKRFVVSDIKLRRRVGEVIAQTWQRIGTEGEMINFHNGGFGISLRAIGRSYASNSHFKSVT